ncbi:hypothetical protein ABPG72_001942 [Tetrahymena utriculariae]
MSREIQNITSRKDNNQVEETESNSISHRNNSEAIHQNSSSNEKYDEEGKNLRKYIKELNEYHLSFESEKYSNPLKFGDLYEFQFIIGRGAFGQVICAIQKSNKQRVAIKIVEKKQLKKFEGLDQEAKILQQLEHQFIIKYLNSHESSKVFMIVMEYFDGCSLNEFLRNRDKALNNDEIRRIIKKILLAINHIHSLDIIHRDLKPDNILIKEQSGLFDIKVIDFGLSFKNENVGTVSNNCGTLIYMAPEVAFNRQYQRSVDLWTTGIIQYMLFTMGKHPLWEKKDDKKSFLNKLKNPQWVFPDNMDKEARQFFLKTAAIVAEDRMNVAQCLKHVWISREGNLSVPLTMHDQIQCFQNCETFSRVCKLLLFTQYIKSLSKSKGFFEQKVIDIFVERSNKYMIDESIYQEDKEETKEKSVSFNSANLEDSVLHQKSVKKFTSSFMQNNNQKTKYPGQIKRNQTFDDEHYILNVKMSQSKYNFNQKSLTFKDQISESYRKQKELKADEKFNLNNSTDESYSCYKSGSSHNQSQNEFRTVSSRKVGEIGVDEDIINPIGINKELLTRSNAGDSNSNGQFNNHKSNDLGANQQVLKKQSIYHIRKYNSKKNQNELQNNQHVKLQQDELQDSINDAYVDSPLQSGCNKNIFFKQPQNKHTIQQIQHDSLLQRSSSSKNNFNIRRNSKSSVNLQYAKSNTSTPQNKKEDIGNISFYNQYYMNQTNDIHDYTNKQNFRMNTLNEQQEESMLTERSNPQNSKRDDIIQFNFNSKHTNQAIKTIGGGDDQSQMAKQSKSQLSTNFQLKNVQASPSQEKIKNAKSINFKNTQNTLNEQKSFYSPNSNMTPQKTQKQMQAIFSPRSSCPINKTQLADIPQQNSNIKPNFQQLADSQFSNNSQSSRKSKDFEQNRKKKATLKSNFQVREISTLSQQNSPQMHHKFSFQQEYLNLDSLQPDLSENMFKKRRSFQNNYDEQFKGSLLQHEKLIINDKQANQKQQKPSLILKIYHSNAIQDNELKLPQAKLIYCFLKVKLISFNYNKRPINLQNRSISMQQNNNERSESQGNLSNISVNSFNSDQPVQAPKLQQNSSTSSLKIYDKAPAHVQHLKSHFYNDSNSNNSNQNLKKQNSISITSNNANLNNQNQLINNQLNSLQINGRSSYSSATNYNSLQKKSIIKLI